MSPPIMALVRATVRTGASACARPGRGSRGSLPVGVVRAVDAPRPGWTPGLGDALVDGDIGRRRDQLPLARQVFAVIPTLPRSDRQYLPARGGSMWALYPEVRADQK